MSEPSRVMPVKSALGVINTLVPFEAQRDYFRAMQAAYLANALSEPYGSDNYWDFLARNSVYKEAADWVETFVGEEFQASLLSALNSKAFPQKTATGLLGGKTTKAAAARSMAGAVAAKADKVAAVNSERWIDQQLAAARARARKFGATGGLKTGTLKTGGLTPAGLVHRIKKSFRRRKR